MNNLPKRPKNYPQPIIKPLIGVLSCPIGPKARPILANYKEMIVEGKKRGLTVYVFHPSNVDWNKKKVVGWTLSNTNSGKSRWIEFQFPLFDVVYNRIPNRQAENHPEVKELLKCMRQENIPIFNPCFLDKWVTYTWLAQNREIASHLPRTELLEKSGLQLMLKRNGSAYIKPRLGSLGRGIVRIDKTNHGFRFNIRTAKGYVSNTETDIDKVMAQLKTFHPLQDYMMQETINLAKYQNRVFDIRTLIQKDIQGEWKVTGMGVRLAAENAHLTHVTNGGQVLPLKKVLGNLLEENELRMHVIYDRIIELARSVASCIENASGLQFGELSMDIALDVNLSLWLIEANSKPFHFDEPGIRKLSRNRVLDYATYLSRQK